MRKYRLCSLSILLVLVLVACFSRERGHGNLLLTLEEAKSDAQPDISLVGVDLQILPDNTFFGIIVVGTQHVADPTSCGALEVQSCEVAYNCLL